MAVSKKPRKLDSNELWDYALRALATRAHSSGEIRQKLIRRSQSSADVNATMAKLREYGLADDARFSETFAASRLQNQAFGRFRVLQQLRGKRVAPQVAKKAVDKVFAGTDEIQLIESYLARKFRGRNLSELLQDPKHLVSAYRRLRTAGFSSANSIRVLKQYSRAAEGWEDTNENEGT